MRLDHIAFRVLDRDAAVAFTRLLGFELEEEFQIDFSDGSQAKCVAMRPPEKKVKKQPWTMFRSGQYEYHLAPEMFVSEGEPDSIVGDWVRHRENGGIHHIAFQIQSLDKLRETVDQWREAGVKFTSDEIMACPDDELHQIFTEPIDVIGGIIIELIS